jgi:hypothetical protein
MKSSFVKRLAVDKRSLFLILAGSFIWSITMVKSGIKYSYGIGFWGPNGHDGVWHIALIESLSRGSLEIPVFAGEQLKNYHIGFDLVVSILHKLTFIPVRLLYFQILPPLFALLIGLFVYRFIMIWKNDKAMAFWSLFFVYFGGSFGFILTIIRNGVINGESLFWSQQSVSTLVNPPFAMSVIFLFAGLYYLVLGVRHEKKKYMIVSALLLGVLVQIKVYAGILVLGGLAVAGFWKMLRRDKNKILVNTSVIKVFAATAVISILLFPNINTSVSSLIFKPFWFLEEMMSTPDRVCWPRFAQALANYKLSGNWLKAGSAYIFAFVVFVVGNFGTRLIGKLYIARKLKRKSVSYIDILIFSMIVAGVLLPLIFVQQGTPWNTIQFMYYSLVFMGILAGIAFADFIKHQGFIFGKQLVAFILILLTLLTTFGTMKHYLPSRPPAKISNSELDALEFLSNKPDGVVLTQPFNKNAAQTAITNPPRPLYLYESTAYVSAFTQKPVYLEDVVNLEITGYDWLKRRNKVYDFFNPDVFMTLEDMLKENNISYIYIVKTLVHDISKLEQRSNIQKIYENSEVLIFSVI